MIYKKEQRFGCSREWKRQLILLIVFVFVVGSAFGFFLGRMATTAFGAEIESEIIEDTVEIVPAEPEDVPADEEQFEISEPLPVYYDIPLDTDLQDYIRELSEDKNVPMELILAVIYTESNFRITAISKGGDYGLMQINSQYHDYFSEKYGVTDFLDPYQNVYCGTSILAEHLEKYENIHRALMAYNMGAGGAKKAWDNGIYSTQYSEKVVAKYEEYLERS
jgi:hypothetical protein